MSIKKHLYTVSKDFNVTHHGVVDITHDGYVSGGINNLEPTPIEDWYMWCTTPESEPANFDIIDACIAHL